MSIRPAVLLHGLWFELAYTLFGVQLSQICDVWSGCRRVSSTPALAWRDHGLENPAALRRGGSLDMPASGYYDYPQ